MTPHEWHPIDDLPGDAGAMASASLAALRPVWVKQKRTLQDSPALTTFLERQVRQWSIQTGILERLYTLDEAVTLTLVEQGFDAAYVPHGASDLPAERLIRILEDHREAAEGLFAFVKGDRRLSTSYVKELHAVLCRHQETATGIDSLGRVVEVPLVKGAFKKRSNDPRDPRTGEVVFHYCPPEHVDAEMDRLVAMHLAHHDVPSEVECAWLHHRFVQIHPFQDGNGRVARALATLVCLRDGGFPLVVMADQKPRYIEVLRAADRGDLHPFVTLVADQQEAAFRQALSISDEALAAPPTIEALLADARRRIEKQTDWTRLSVHDRAEALAGVARRVMETVADQVRAAMAGMSPPLFVTIESQRFESMSMFHRQAMTIAKRLGYAANPDAEHWWSELRLERGETTRLVVSLHHVGPREQGLMAASAFLVQIASIAAVPRVSETPVCDRMLPFTADVDGAKLEVRFEAWLHDAVRVGLEAWRQGL